ncbi:MAG: DUF2785 domain-containing protein [Nocardioidaceae bacterium]|nr:MAG: DUF2785 domain-containing protein [Nocardioidaceae bacterium]
MGSAYWESVLAQGVVPADRPLSELTSELTSMLGDSDPAIREDIATLTLTRWLRAGVYDDLLEGLGDGMASGLTVGLGTTASDTVFRRSLSARVLGACIAQDNAALRMRPDTVLRWGDRLMSWLVRERDLRHEVPGKGPASSLGNGAAALVELASSRHLGRLELTVLLDVTADRLTSPTDFLVHTAELDTLAESTMGVLRRDILHTDLLDAWVNRLTATALDPQTGAPVAHNVAGFLRALYVQLALSSGQPPNRADFLLTLVAALKQLHPGILQG